MARFDGTEGNDLLPSLIPGTLLALGDDTFFGKGGDDIIVGYAGDDVINGGEGADIIIGGTLTLTLNVGSVSLSGIDTASYTDSNAGVTVDLSATTNLVLDLPLGGVGYTRVGIANAVQGQGGDAEGDILSGITNLFGSRFRDILTGNGDDNHLFGGGGNDILNGGAGDDILSGGTGIDALIGGSGNDHYYVDRQSDTIAEVSGGGTADRVFAGTSYTLAAGVQVEIMSVQGGSHMSNAISLSGNEFAQTIYGNSGINTLSGAGGADTLFGYGGNDTLDGGTGADMMRGGEGNDTFLVDNRGDRVAEAAGEGSDTVISSVSYSLAGGAEVEKLIFSNADATTPLNLTGNEFGQTIIGNAGINILAGGGGVDTLTGGAGNDRFFFNAALGSNNVDVITDFGNVAGNNDTVRLENSIFTALTQVGVLAAGLFAANASGTATDGDDHILYNTTTGGLFYDADGSGSDAAVQFATLTGAPTLKAYDFYVV